MAYNDRATALQGWLLLGRAYFQIGEWDLAASAYEHAVALSSAPAVAHLAAARAWVAVGVLDKAMHHCRQATERDPSSGEAWLLSAQIQLRNLRLLPPDERDTRSLDEALERAEASHSSSWQLSIAKAEASLLQARPTDESLEVLRLAEARFPDALEMWQNLVPLYEQMGARQDADRAVDRCRQLDNDSASICVLRAKLLSDRKQWAEARRLLRDAQAKALALAAAS
jgi:tetratricopeptide (TPR) repeat protein